MTICTHGMRIDYGKHNGELFTRLPVSYLRYIINQGAPMADVAKAEFERRGDTMPKVELSGHAIDSASIRVSRIWRDTMNEGEGIYSWLQRMTLEAIEHGEPRKSGRIRYNGMEFAIAQGEEFPTLKTIVKVK